MTAENNHNHTGPFTSADFHHTRKYHDHKTGAYVQSDVATNEIISQKTYNFQGELLRPKGDLYPGWPEVMDNADITREIERRERKARGPNRGYLQNQNVSAMAFNIGRSAEELRKVMETLKIHSRLLESDREYRQKNLDDSADTVHDSNTRTLIKYFGQLKELVQQIEESEISRYTRLDKEAKAATEE